MPSTAKVNINNINIIMGKINEQTIEKAAKDYVKGWGESNDEKSFIAGAKWILERSYSELDLKQAYAYNNRLNSEQSFEDWFLLFKK